LAEAHYRLALVYARLGEKVSAEKAMATFQQFRTQQMTERQEMLKSLREVVQPNASKKSGG
jgi:hypothetical protein